MNLKKKETIALKSYIKRLEELESDEHREGKEGIFFCINYVNGSLTDALRKLG